MLTDMRLHEIMEDFGLIVQGATAQDIMEILDQMIENEQLGEDEFKANEMEILNAIDARFFTCNNCGWTMPIDEQDERGEWDCHQCMDEEHGQD